MFLEELVSQRSGGTTIVDDSGVHPLAGLQSRIDRLHRHLAGQHVTPGEIVVLLAENGAGFVAGVLGIVSFGAVVALVDPALPPATLARLVRSSGAGVLCCSGRGPAQHVERLPELAGGIRVIAIEPQDGHVPPNVPRTAHRGRNADEPAVVIYSSGTTGEPKGVVLAHRAIVRNVLAIADYLQPGPDDTFLILKSMVHSSTLVGEVLVALAHSARVIALHPLVTPRQMFHRIHEFRPTIIGLNPSILRFFLHDKAGAGMLESVRIVHVSGSIVDGEVVAGFRRRFPFIHLINGYGLTEAGPRVSCTRRGAEHKTNSVGRPLRDVEIDVVRADGGSCSPAETGEILVRSPSLCAGYLVDARLQALTLTNGWLRTGDLGHRDAEGDLYVTGRRDELIVTSSHKVNPVDVEAVVKTARGVLDCLVFGMEDPLLGQRIVCAFTRDETAEVSAGTLESEIRALCARLLASFQMPKTVVCWDALPTGPGGKKSRRLAQHRLQGGVGA